MSIEENALYTPAEVAGLLRCGKSNVYNLISRGEIAVTRVGAGKACLRVRGSGVLAFLESRTEGGPRPLGEFEHLGKYLN
jgi:excisionase family DNA binding protein